MARVSVASARDFVARAEVAPVAHTRRATTPSTSELALDTAKNQAALVGSDIISFDEGVTAERREAIIDSSMLAQLVAKKQVADSTEMFAWYDSYFDTLSNIGWVIQERNFAEYQEKSENFEGK